MKEYDICIVGAGIAGLYCARELSRSHPKSSICILEKYEFIGGRTSTFRDTFRGIDIQWEEGAGRIHETHHQTLRLLREYNLDVVPIGGGIEWRTSAGSEPIEFGKYIANMGGLSDIPHDILSNMTMKGLLDSTLGKARSKELLDRYEYRSELDTLRADKALEVLSHELGEQGGFCVVKEGFSALVREMKNEIEKAGVVILRKHEVLDIEKVTTGYSVHVKGSPSIRASKVIAALPRNAVAAIPCFKGLPILKQVAMRPLLRIYAIFPVVKGMAWFHGVKKFVCDPPVRYVIPLDPTKGTIMISYTDGKDAEHWSSILKQPKGEDRVIHDIMKQIRSLFPGRHIPMPQYYKIFSWEDGCSYWLPGTYDFNKVSKASVLPLPETMPDLYMCGESWAYNQCWVECAIDQAKHALERMSLEDRLDD
jgi:monoamine oxidase